MKNKQPSHRQLRVGENIRHVLANFFQKDQLVDVCLSGDIISISEVRMTPDLKLATCYFTVLGKPENVETVKLYLNKNTRFIRGKIASVLRQMKYIPEIRFQIDHTFDTFHNINSLLHSPKIRLDLERNCDPDDSSNTS